MMLSLRSVASIMLMVLVMTTGTGCLAVAAAAGAGAGVAYASGDREEVMVGAPAEVAVAAEGTFVDLGLVVTRRADRGSETEVVARTANDKKVSVVAERVGERSSRVSVRAGTWGDDDLHDRVIAGIRLRLESANAPVSSPEPAN